jgi:hypothetical protein
MMMDIVRLLPFVVEQELAKTCFSKLRKSGFQLVQRIGEDFVQETWKQHAMRLFGRRLLPGIAIRSGAQDAAQLVGGSPLQWIAVVGSSCRGEF